MVGPPGLVNLTEFGISFFFSFFLFYFFLHSQRLTWLGLSLMGIQFGFLARLTWWEYSWDVMEPVTYFVTYGTVMGMYAYYCVTRQEYEFR